VSLSFIIIGLSEPISGWFLRRPGTCDQHCATQDRGFRDFRLFLTYRLRTGWLTRFTRVSVFVSIAFKAFALSVLVYIALKEYDEWEQFQSMQRLPQTIPVNCLFFPEHNKIKR
jgi:hypothetical protein